MANLQRNITRLATKAFSRLSQASLLPLDQVAHQRGGSSKQDHILSGALDQHQASKKISTHRRADSNGEGIRGLFELQIAGSFCVNF